ncbi:hypothetical protein C8Q74DRAFT_1291349 [Fomes fomentarius]|nr:hypothetical protein C8Q74DRAFT_1291349 [Fomes fomentarius]
MSPEGLGRLTRFKPFCTRYGDVWSLGIILVNMMSGRHPWALAAPEDECFAQYMRDPDYLKKTLPISDGANTILQRIFTLDPGQRISLTDLRRAIFELNTFFLSEDELAHASECAQFVAASIREGRGFTGSTTGSVVSGTTQDELSEEDVAEVQVGYTHTTSKTLLTTPAPEISRPHYPELVIEEQECFCSAQSISIVNASLQPGFTGARRARDENDVGEAVWKRARHIGPGDT